LSGLLVIEGLLKKGFLIEVINEEDKKAKLVSLTKKEQKNLSRVMCHYSKLQKLLLW
jgi:DNA-binding MarR family transcriptional regulator